MSLPCGFSAAGLPIGMQLIGKPFDEATILRTGYAFEQATQFRMPPGFRQTVVLHDRGL